MNLEYDRPRSSDREEQLGVPIEAGGTLTPAHADLNSACPPSSEQTDMVDAGATVMGTT
jgi:hypothetical protein